MKKKYAFFLMGSEFHTETDTAVFETAEMQSYIYTVNNLKQAVQQAKVCLQQGVGAIELCGAFGAEGAEKIIEATQYKIAVGYVVHNPEQEPLFTAFFNK